jgi:predicted transcriptional regulator
MSGMGNAIKGMGNDLIREGRRRVGWTQARLADEAGTTQSAIARLEAGTTSPSFDDVIRLLRAMKLDLDFMLVERDDSDWIQAQRMLPLSTDDRHEHRRSFVEQVDKIRARAA